MFRFVNRLILGVLLASVALAWGSDDATGPRPSAVPVIELKRLEPQVARQLESVHALLLEVTSKTAATSLQRANAYGEFGRVLQAYGYATEAADCYHQSTQYQPEDSRWWHLLGSAYEAAGKLTEAEAAFRQGIKYGNYQATRVRLANVLTQLNRRDEAQRLFAELLATDPKLAAAHAGAGTLALEGRDFPVAVKHLSRALELAPAATRLHYSLAMAYRGMGDLEQARQHLRQRGNVGIRPDDPLVDELPQLLQGTQVHLLRGKVAFAAGAISDAIREFRLAVEAAPDNVSARVNLAVALVKTETYAEAISQLDAALEREPTNAAALFNLASLRHSQRDFSAAVPLLRTLVKLEPKDLAARQLLAQSLMEIEESSQASEVLREGLKLVPDDETTTLLLAELLAKQQQYADALSLLNGASTKHPDRGMTAHALARQLASCPDAKLRDGDRALRLAKIVHDARPSFEHTETLAMALAATNRFEEAIRLQQQLLAAAQQQRVAKVVNRIQQNLARYEQRETAR